MKKILIVLIVFVTLMSTIACSKKGDTPDTMESSAITNDSVIYDNPGANNNLNQHNVPSEYIETFFTTAKSENLNSMIANSVTEIIPLEADSNVAPIIDALLDKCSVKYLDTRTDGDGFVCDVEVSAVDMPMVIARLEAYAAERIAGGVTDAQELNALLQSRIIDEINNAGVSSVKTEITLVRDGDALKVVFDGELFETMTGGLYSSYLDVWEKSMREGA